MQVATYRFSGQGNRKMNQRSDKITLCLNQETSIWRNLKCIHLTNINLVPSICEALGRKQKRPSHFSLMEEIGK